MKPIGRRKQQQLRHISKNLKDITTRVNSDGVDKISIAFMPDFSNFKDPIGPPENLDHTVVVYVDNNNKHFYDSCHKELDSFKLCVINDSSSDISGSIRPEIYLGKAGAINYSFSFINTGYMSIVDPEDCIVPVLNFREACLIASPVSVEGLWSSDVVPRILSMRLELAKRIGFNWDLTDSGLIIKEFLFYFASQFPVHTVDRPPYSEEKNKQEAISIRREFIDIYPYLFTQKSACDLLKKRVNIKPFIVR